ncbi:MAG: hypothetical protein LC667_07875, partial [Thioalkalivibrio sp.]|nr:hypothetical protein [Thioalkalivibrio sp.]
LGKSRPRVMPPLPVWLACADQVLGELPPDLAIELWLQLRHVDDWRSGANRTELFHPQPSARVQQRRALALVDAGALAEQIRVFHAMTDGEEVTADEIASACIRIADWANESGFIQTAEQFSGAGAAAGPENPTVLNAAGLMHRRAGSLPAAELYYQRAAACAHQQKNTDERVSAHIGLAALWCARRQFRRARHHLDRASNIAQRTGSTWLAAHTQHDLMLMLTERRDFMDAEGAAARASALYPLNDPRFPFFAADFAFLLVAQGCHREAIPLLEQFIAMIADRPAQQVIGLSLLARAYAGAGRETEYATTRDKAAELVRVYPVDAGAAYFHLAEAARVRRKWDDASHLAALSQRAASARGDKAVVRYAESLAAAIAAKQPASESVGNAGGLKRATANALSLRLRRWNPQSRRGRPRQPRRDHWSGV